MSKIKNNHPPKLFLAPMEGVGCKSFRRSIATIGGFDEACTEFIRVPTNAHVKSLAKVYDPFDTAPIPQAAQVMGSIPNLMADMAAELQRLGAPRIDLNCGCPSNTVTGRGAGSTLLKTPTSLYSIAKAMKEAISVPLSIKLRAGFEDTSLFKENILAAQESGASFITLHPRTKVQGYSGKADWSLIKLAKETLTIPVVGNGDIKTVEDAHRMLAETNCDAIMIGRGAVINPWIFHEIKFSFGLESKKHSWQETENYIHKFNEELLPHTKDRNLINQLKQLFGFLFQKNQRLQELRLTMLQLRPTKAAEFLSQVLPLYQEGLTHG